MSIRAIFFLALVTFAFSAEAITPVLSPACRLSLILSPGKLVSEPQYRELLETHPFVAESKVRALTHALDRITSMLKNLPRNANEAFAYMGTLDAVRSEYDAAETLPYRQKLFSDLRSSLRASLPRLDARFPSVASSVRELIRSIDAVEGISAAMTAGRFVYGSSSDRDATQHGMGELLLSARFAVLSAQAHYECVRRHSEADQSIDAMVEANAIRHFVWVQKLENESITPQLRPAFREAGRWLKRMEILQHHLRLRAYIAYLKADILPDLGWRARNQRRRILERLDPSHPEYLFLERFPLLTAEEATAFMDRGGAEWSRPSRAELPVKGPIDSALNQVADQCARRMATLEYVIAQLTATSAFEQEVRARSARGLVNVAIELGYGIPDPLSRLEWRLGQNDALEARSAERLARDAQELLLTGEQRSLQNLISEARDFRPELQLEDIRPEGGPTLRELMKTRRDLP